jgi:hypothetical protein
MLNDGTFIGTAGRPIKCLEFTGKHDGSVLVAVKEGTDTVGVSADSCQTGVFVHDYYGKDPVKRAEECVRCFLESGP